MPYTTLVGTTDLASHLDNPSWAVIDCRFSLNDTWRGRRDYRRSHIPGAVYAHLDEDLSGPVVQGATGRHPLPSVQTFAETLSRWGIAEGVQVVAYDDAGGAIAARLWWMLRWLGHEAVAVLDGGWPAWEREGLPTEKDVPQRTPRTFIPRVQPARLATTADVQHPSAGTRLLDARAPERYRGEHEPIDLVAGHIPGALCAPFANNLDASGHMRSPAELRARFERLLSGTPAGDTVCYCGSGVTGAHNVLALEHAGLPGARLYAGSWSEWITDPSRPVERDKATRI